MLRREQSQSFLVVCGSRFKVISPDSVRRFSAFSGHKKRCENGTDKDEPDDGEGDVDGDMVEISNEHFYTHEA